ncbi:MAG: CHAT domain-containing protein [Bacteroidota bacterium]
MKFLPIKITTLLLTMTWCFTPLPAFCQEVDDLEKKADSLIARVDIYNKPNSENIPRLLEALDLYKQSGNMEKYLDHSGDLASAYFYEKNYKHYFPIVNLITRTSIEMYGEKSAEYVNSLYFLAHSNFLKGNAKRSVEILKECLQILQENFPEEKPLYALESTGYINSTLGDYDESVFYYQELLKQLDETNEEDYHQLSRTYRQLGWCYIKKSDYEQAQYCYRKCLSILKKLPQSSFFQQTEWYAHQNLSELYLNKNVLDSALFHIRKAIQVQEASAPLEAYKSYLQFGDLLRQDNQLQAALYNYQKAYSLAIEEYSDFNKHPSFGSCQAKIAAVSYTMHRDEESLALFQNALSDISFEFAEKDIFQNPTGDQLINKKIGLEILESKASVLYDCYLDTGKKDLLSAAHECYQSIFELLKDIRKDYLAEGSKHNLARRAVPLYERSIKVCLELYKLTDDEAFLQEGLLVAEGNKSVLMFESIKDEMAKGYAGIPDSLLEREREIIAELNFYQKSINESRQKKKGENIEKIKMWESMVFNLRSKYQALTSFLESEFPSYYSLKYNEQSTSVDLIRQYLPDEKSALVEFMLGDQSAFVFYLTKHELKAYELKDIASLGEQIHQFRQLVMYPPNSKDFKTDLAKFKTSASGLYDYLLKKGLEDLSGGINNLIIVPDDVLAYLPFEILVRELSEDGNDNYSPAVFSFLINDFNVSYQYSASLMVASKDKEKPEEDIAGFVGFAPTFDGGYSQKRTCSSDQLYSLLCNEQEITAIQNILGGEIFVAAHAGLDRFHEEAANYRILHLATHACVDNSDVGLNKIYLSDGDLSQFELNNLRLNAELAVLSACNTGTGKLQKGEGVMSLTRSFMLAGSESVLTSLWSVDDCATSDIMVEYYKCLKKGMKKDMALRTAKLNYIKTADLNNSHPYYWGAFVQFGEIAPLEMPDQNRWWIYASVIGLLVGIWLFYKGFRNREKLR